MVAGSRDRLAFGSMGFGISNQSPFLIALGKRVKAGVELGTRASFADIGATVEEALGLEPVGPGVSFLPALLAR